MKKNQIFIKCGTEYKEMTKELLEACNLAGEPWSAVSVPVLWYFPAGCLQLALLLPLL